MLRSHIYQYTMMDYENITEYFYVIMTVNRGLGVWEVKNKKRTQALMGHHHYAHILPSKTGHPKSS